MADLTTTDVLTPRQYKALGSLLASPSIRQAAIDAGIPEKTMYNWLKSPDFDIAYREARRSAFTQATARAQQAAVGAVSVAIKIMVKETARDGDRLEAAKLLYGWARQSIEVEDLRNELEQLQALVRDRIGDESSDL